MKQIVTLFLMVWSVVLAGCANSDTDGAAQLPGEVGEPIVVIDGKVRFYLSVDAAAPSLAMGLPASGFAAEDQVRVNNQLYTVQADAKNRLYIDVDATEDHLYRAGFYRGVKYFPVSCFSEALLLPHAQYYKGSAHTMPEFPMYASYTKTIGNKLVFRDVYAVVGVGLTGSASITSIKVEDLDGEKLAGHYRIDKDLSKLVNEGDSGINFVTLNCTREGVGAPLSSTEQVFYVAISARSYTSGLRVTICDSNHQAVFHTIPALTLAPNSLHKISLNYAPASDLLFYEGFDNCVWGGDIMGGEGALALSPSNAKIGVESGKELTGYEDPLAVVSCDNPGTGFMQPNTWDSTLNVAENPQMSKSYLQSRNLLDWGYLFRTQEYQGCVAVGAGNTGRGVMQTCGMKNIGAPAEIEVSFKYCLQANISDDLLFEIVNGGMITSCTLNGQPFNLTNSNLKYESNASILTVARSLVEIPSSAVAPKKWNTVTLRVKEANDATALYWASSTSVSGIHGIYVDEIKVTKGAEIAKPANNLRVVIWNIQNGMWSDQGNNYDNFVKWVKRYDPDVCVWCEAQTIYKTGTSSACTEQERYLVNGWGELAARYGHNYWVKGGHRDNFPQVITSKYPITKIQDIIGESSNVIVSHGAGHSRITVNGQPIDIVTLHLWPQSYGFGVPSSGQAVSTANNEGDKYRLREMTYICEQTMLNPTHSGVQNWLMMGDLNSRSVYDNWFYKYAATDTKLLVTKYIDEKTPMQDIIADRYPGSFVSSTGGSARIDYMFASPAMYGRIHTSLSVIDSFAAPKADVATSFYHPSDHRPILVDYDMK